MTQEEIEQLEEMALRVREHIIRLSTDGGCFTGASLSCADLIVYLYNRVLNVGPHNFDAPDRDYLFLSKGHDVPALYGTFVELGWLAADRLRNHLKTNDYIYWHPNRKTADNGNNRFLHAAPSTSDRCAGCTLAAIIRFCSEISAPVKSRETWPCAIITTRFACRTSSGSSDEIISTASPSPARRFRIA